MLARAKTAYNRGEYLDALGEYQKVQKLMPNHLDLYKVIGEEYEKLGGDDDLKAAIESYNQYLKLSPDAEDRNEILDKTAALEYIFEKQIEQTKILDDLSGLWISDLVFKKDNNRPYVILKVEEVAGKFRVTLLPESGIFAESIYQKTVNIVPAKDNSFRFTFADTYVHNPSSSAYNMLRIGVAALGGSELTQGLMQEGVNMAEEGDLQSNTTTGYHFELKYNNGKMEGLLNILQKHANTEVSQTTQDNIYEISFTKRDISYRENFIHYVNDSEKEEILKSDHESYQLYSKGLQITKQANAAFYSGLITAGLGVASLYLMDGFHAEIYCKNCDSEKTKEYVLAFRGTEGEDMYDVITDVGQGMGTSVLSGQYYKAKDFAKYFKEKCEDCSISITGHSLGGGLASAAGLATGLPTYTFNAAGVHQNTIQNVDPANKANEKAIIKAYYTEDDPLSLVQDHPKVVAAFLAGAKVAADAILGPGKEVLAYYLKKHVKNEIKEKTDLETGLVLNQIVDDVLDKPILTLPLALGDRINLGYAGCDCRLCGHRIVSVINKIKDPLDKANTQINIATDNLKMQLTNCAAFE